MAMNKLLPHEISMLERVLDRGREENNRAAVDMAHAASDTNSWHDNAEYDEVRDRMKLIDARYLPVVRILAEKAIGQYPELGEPAITLGSLVSITFESGESQNILVVGQVREGVNMYQEEWLKDGRDDELLVVSAESPLGMALAGCRPGETAVYTIKDRSISVHVNGVDQSWINRFATELS